MPMIIFLLCSLLSPFAVFALDKDAESAGVRNKSPSLRRRILQNIKEGEGRASASINTNMAGDTIASTGSRKLIDFDIKCKDPFNCPEKCEDCDNDVP